MPDIVIFIDAITIVFEEAPKDGPPICLPISCIEAGNEYSLPNLSLRCMTLSFKPHTVCTIDFFFSCNVLTDTINSQLTRQCLYLYSFPVVRHYTLNSNRLTAILLAAILLPTILGPINVKCKLM